MTTIAYRSGVMAADSGVFMNDTLEFSHQKVMRLSDGRLFGACGDSGFIQKVIRWLEAGSDPDHVPTLLSDGTFSALLVSPDGGTVWSIDKYLELIPAKGEYFADGSGRNIALGAMAAGASAREAVEIACRFDVTSAGPIDTICSS